MNWLKLCNHWWIGFKISLARKSFLKSTLQIGANGITLPNAASLKAYTCKAGRSISTWFRKVGL
jgi:hypothetical protein